jgi:hypothetical protein
MAASFSRKSTTCRGFNGKLVIGKAIKQLFQGCLDHENSPNVPMSKDKEVDLAYQGFPDRRKGLTR